jgi:filamentous hemagglutinin family protein
MEVQMNAPLPRRLRPSLLLGCAACALAGWSGAAGAQAFDAFPNTVFGNVTYNRATPGVETITVNSPTAVIDWSNQSPLNPFVFLPAGRVATFQNGAGNPDFVALNRILVTVPVRFDGRVVSQLVDASGTRPGGTLLFATPGGIIVGANAVFDVGSLVLTTLDVDVDGAGNFYDPATRGFTFSSGLAAAPGAVVTEAGARINAPGANSYVALVAPSIDHAGSIRVNGAAAFVAGNQVELRANDGLFDIIVPVGTDAATPINHRGTTGGPASSGAADVHRIYMVAVPRNTAITAVLGGNVGFDEAVNAAVENGAIVLSAGYNVVGGSADTRVPVNTDLQANLSIQGGTITSRLTGSAVTNAIASGNGGTLHATQDLTLVGGQSAALRALGGETVRMDRNVALVSPGGSAGIVASGGGSITISGNALVDATGTGFSPPKTGDAGNGTGGEARIYADGGSISISGDATLRALGIGGNAAVGDYIGAGGNGYGGDALVEGTNGGTVSIGGNLSADASGIGGWTSGYDASQQLVGGATGQGGDVQIIAAQGGSVAVAGATSLASNGTGGNSGLTPGGRGQGDDVLIQTRTGSVTLGGAVAVSAVGRGGDGLGGGDGIGGELIVQSYSGPVRISGAASVALNGIGGAAPGNGNGGAGTGGQLNIFADADAGAIDIFSLDGHADGTGGYAFGANAGDGRGGGISISTSSPASVAGARPGIRIGALAGTANGTGGTAGPSDLNAPPAIAGRGTGGAIQIFASQAPVRIDGATSLAANGTGGAGPSGASPGGAGLGGGIAIATDRTSLTLGTATRLAADGRGGDGASGGDGTGGELDLESNGGTLDLGAAVAASATGTGGGARTGNGGAGTGGSLQLAAFQGGTPSRILGGTIAVTVGGTGGASAGSGAGGAGTGGRATIYANADTGSIDLAALNASADGSGGAAQAGPAGAGQGGNILIYTQNDGAIAGARPGIHLGALAAGANGSGGNGGAGGVNGVPSAAGAGTGGRVDVQASQAPIRVDGATSLAANGTGGAAAAAAPGANGLGGTVAIGADRSQVDLGTTSLVRADGRGGAGLAGGTGTGGQVIVEAAAGDVDLADSATLSASGAGGAARSGRGGDGSGGSVQATARTSSAPSRITGGAVSAAATGTGGSGGAAGTLPAGRGGDGRGGAVGLIAETAGGTLAFGATSASAAGIGGNAGAAPSQALAGRGGDGIGGSATAGTAQAVAPCGAAGGCPTGSATFASLALAAQGSGGAGGTGGNGTGGTAQLQAVGAPTNVTGIASLGADGIAGIGTPGTNGQAFGGLLVLAASPDSGGNGGRLQAGTVDGTANAVGGSAGSTAGRWRVSANAGSNVTATNATLAAGGGTVLPAASTVNALNGIVGFSATAALSSAGSIQVNAAGTGQLNGGAVQLNAGDDVIFSDANPAANAVAVDVASLNVTAADDFILNSGAVTRSSGATSVRAGDLATIAGRMLGNTIQLASADIDLGGAVGGTGTARVTLQVLPAPGAALPNQVVLGGTTQGPGYTLTAAEAGRIATGQLDLLVPVTGTSANRAPDLLVRDLSLNATGTTGFVGNLNLNVGSGTAGIAETVGNLALTGAGATNGISIQAGERVQIVNPTGSVRVRDAAGFPAGTLTISAANIWSASRNLLDRLAADPAFAGRDQALLTNDGPDQPRGYIEGAEINLRAGSTLLVQNSGTRARFAGITTVQGTLTIVPTGTAPLDTYAFGNRINADGSFTTNTLFFREVVFNPNGPVTTVTFTPRAAFNTCIIATRQCGGAQPVPGRDPIVGPFVPVPLTAPDSDPVDASFATEPLIEEPVTSGGESSIWNPPCDPRQDRQCPGTRP